MNLEIQFNKAIIQKIKEFDFQVDQLGSVLFILFCLYEGRVDLLDEFDDWNKQRRAIFLYKELEIRGLVYESAKSNEEEKVWFSLTKNGIALVEFLKVEFQSLKENVTSEVIAIAGVDNLKEQVVEEDSIIEWIDEWIDIFPRGIKSGGKLLRSDKPSCIRKMNIFMKEYPYDKDTIIAATKAYINSKAQEGFMYTRCAVYFIYRIETSVKDKTSDLAAWCDQVLHDKSQKGFENNLDILV